MSSTRRFMNWTGVTFTPTNGAPTSITGVTSIQIDSGGNLLKFSGDGDRFSTTVVNDFNDPSVTVHSADLAAVLAFPVGTVGTFIATHNDAKNGDRRRGGHIRLDQRGDLIEPDPRLAPSVRPGRSYARRVFIRWRDQPALHHRRDLMPHDARPNARRNPIPSVVRRGGKLSREAIETPVRVLASPQGGKCLRATSGIGAFHLRQSNGHAQLPQPWDSLGRATLCVGGSR